MDKTLITLRRIDRFLLFALLLFSALILPFIASIPYLDGNIDFVQVNDFYTGGFSQYFENWRSVHPPFKLILVSVFLKLGELNSFSYTLVGLIFGIFGIITIFFLSRELFNRQTARISAILLATSPLFLATGIFCLRDYLLTVLTLVSLYFYSKRKYTRYAFAASLAVLTKETALILSGSIIAVEAFYFIKKAIRGSKPDKDSKFIFFLIPFLVFFFWLFFLKVNGQKSWSDWIFTETASKGTYYTILNNLVTFRFLNKYAYQHWRQLFFLNFNWVYWLIVLIGSIIIFQDKNGRRIIAKEIKFGTIKAKALLIIGLFAISYFLSVLSLQTYTIPRYTLPLIPFLLMTTSFAIKTLTTKVPILRSVVFIFLGVVIFSSLFFSLDPISTKLWGKIDVLGEEIYALNRHLAGNDGITYNMQYLFIVKKRTKQILVANKQRKLIISDECHWLFPDIRNDKKTIKILQLNNLDPNNLCRIRE